MHPRHDPASATARRFALRPIPAFIRRSLLISAGIALAPPLLTGDAMAGPQGGQVVAGQGSIQRHDARTTVIEQQSHSLAIDWQSFNLDRLDLVRFNQPSSSASVLNRIFDQNPSQILGTIQANGRVFLMNPNGFVFGAEARVSVGSLFATSLNIEVEDFMQGRYEFSTTDGKDGGPIINRGLIEAASGGSVSLVGGAVSNEGVILADVGHVHLAAGRTAVVDFDGDGLVRFAVDGEVLENAYARDAAVENSGEIHADGGPVLFTASAAQDVFSQVVNNAGVVLAGKIEKTGGIVHLVGLGGAVVNTGTIDVSASRPGEDGGAVSITGDSVRQYGTLRADAIDGDGGRIELVSQDTTLLGGDSITSARSASGGKGGTVHALGVRVGLVDTAAIDVSGDLGGGTVLVGGDYQGDNPEVANAAVTYMAAGARIKADAISEGDGGKVIVWADHTTRAYGDITARGGKAGGDGGLVETSGKQYLDVEGIGVDASAFDGQAGVWLLDPLDIEISSSPTQNTLVTGPPDTIFAPNDLGTSVVSVQNVVDNLNLGTNVTVQTTGTPLATNPPGQLGDITVNADINKTLGSDATLRLEAANDIVINNAITSVSNALSVEMVALGSINAGNSITTNGGSLTSTGNAFTSTGVIDTGGGDIGINHSGAVTMADTAEIDAGSGSVRVTADGNVTLGRLVTSNPTALAVVVASGSGSILDAGDWGGADISSTGGGSVRLAAGGEVGASTGTGAVELEVTGGGIVDVAASGGNVYLSTDSDLTLGNLTTGLGADSIEVTGTASAGLVFGTALTDVSLAGDSLFVFSDGGTVSLDRVGASGTELASVSVDGTGTQGQVTLNGDVLADAILFADLEGGVVLNGTISLDASSGPGDIDLGGTDVSGAGHSLSLTAQTAGDVISIGSVGSPVNPLDNVVVTGAVQAVLGDVVTTGSIAVSATNIAFNGTTYTTAGGGITFAGPVALRAAGPITVTSGGLVGDDISFAGTVDGDQSLILAAGGGNVAVQGSAGGSTALAGLAIDTANDVSLQALTTDNGSIRVGTDGANRIAGTLTLHGDLVSHDGGDAGAIALYADDIRLDAAGAGSIALEGNSAGGSDGGITVVTGGMLVSATLWQDGLTVDAGSATVDLSGASLDGLDHLVQRSATATLGTLTLGDGGGNGGVALAVTTTVGDLRLTGDLSLTGEGDAGGLSLSSAGAIVLADADGTVAITTDAAGMDQDIVLDRLVDGGADVGLTLAAGSADVSFNGSVGTLADPVGAVTVGSADEVLFNGALATVDAAALGIGNISPVTHVQLDGAVNVDGPVDIDTGTLILSAAMSTAGGGLLSVSNTGLADLNASISSAGGVRFDGTGGLDLALDVSLTAATGNLMVTGPIDLSAAGGTNVIAAVAGAVDLQAGVADSGSPVELEISAGTDLTLDTVTVGNLLDVDVGGTGVGVLTANALSAGTITVDGAGGDDTLNFNGTVTSASGGVSFQFADRMHLAGDVTATGALTISNVSSVVDLGGAVGLTGAGVDMATNVATVNLSGSDGDLTLVTSTGNGNTVALAPVSSDNNPVLALVSEGSLTLADVDIGTGVLTAAVDSNNDSAETLTVGGPLTAGAINLSGGADGGEVLAGPDTANTWNIIGMNAGSLGGAGLSVDAGFSQFAGLRGGTGSDSFSFDDGAAVSGGIDGGVGSDTLNWAAYGSARSVLLTGVGGTDGLNGTEASIGNGFSNLEILLGSGNGDALSGFGTTAVWDINTTRQYTDTATGRALGFGGFADLAGGGGADTFEVVVDHTGILSGGDGNDTFNLRGDSKLDGDLSGGRGDDTFNFIRAGMLGEAHVTGDVDGGLGADTLDLSQSLLSVVVDIAGPGSSDPAAGSVRGTARNTSPPLPDPIGGSFGNINGLVGNNAVLQAPDAPNVWIIDGLDSGTLNGSRFGNFFLAGGTSTDQFTVIAGGSLSLGIDGGNGSGLNSLQGPDAPGIWTTTGPRSGTLSTGASTGAFTGIDAISGGAGVDTFNLGSDGSGNGFLGPVDGGAGADFADVVASFSVPGTLSIGAVETIDDTTGGNVITASGIAIDGATNGIGVSNPLSTAVNTLTLFAPGGSTRITETDGIDLGAIHVGGATFDLTTNAGAIASNTAQTITAGSLRLNAGLGIGSVSTPITTTTSDLSLTSRGAGSAGDIFVAKTGSALSTGGIALATHGATGQTVRLESAFVNYDGDPSGMGANDTLELMGDISLSSNVTTGGSNLILGGPVNFGAGRSIHVGGGDLTFADTVNGTGAALQIRAGNTTLNSDLAVGGVTLDSDVDVAADLSITADAIAFNGGVGSVKSTGGELVLLPETDALDIDIGGSAFLPAASAAALAGFNSKLSIGGETPSPGSLIPASARAGHVTQSQRLDVGGDLTIVALEDLVLGEITAGGTVSLVALGDTSPAGGDIINGVAPGTVNVQASNGVFVAADEIGTVTDPIGVDLDTLDVALGEADVFIAGDVSSVVNLGPASKAVIDGLSAALRLTHPNAAQNLLNIASASNVRNPFLERGTDLQERGLEDVGSVDESLFGEFELFGIEGTGIDVPWYAKEDVLEWTDGDWERYFGRLREKYEKESRPPEEFERFRRNVRRWRDSFALDVQARAAPYAGRGYVGQEWAEGGMGVDDTWSYVGATANGADPVFP